MTAVVFVDVGAHTGETLSAVQSPRFAFDRIHCLEPASACWPLLDRAAARDERVRIHRVGLWSETCRRPLFDPGSGGASLFSEKRGGDPELEETIELVRATEWFQEHVPVDARTYVKLNCEGAECDIVDDLLASGALSRLDSVMIDFDVAKIPSLRHREDETRSRIAEAGLLNCVFAPDVMIGSTHALRIDSWLRAAGLGDDSALGRVRHHRFRATRRLRGMLFRG
jgi:FkbM family methyltransferase